MSMKSMEELKDILCEELDTIAEKGEISVGDLEAVEKLTTSIKNLDKIIMADRYSYDGGNYGDSYGGVYDGESNDRGSYADGSYRGSYRGGRSYRGGNYDGGYGNRTSSRSRHYVRGHYSYADEAGMISDKLEKMMDEGQMNQKDKEVLQQALQILRK